MKNFCLTKVKIVFLLLISTCCGKVMGQTCTLSASYLASESRCAATGSIKITAAGGSGAYQYKVSGPVSTNYTSTNTLTGLSAGKYLVTVLDISTNCVYSQDSVTVAGSYATPGFTMTATRVTCKNGSDGKLTVNGQTFGRAPFSYKIISPSASGVGLTSTAGVFTGLLSGSYLVQLSDSCGAIQTRSIIIDNFDWSINSSTVTKFNCDSISVTLQLKDIFNNLSPHANFNGFLYGASLAAGDTTWFTTNTFKYYKGKKRTATLFVKDQCGNIKSVIWNDTAIPSIGATVTIGSRVCSTFTTTVTSQLNLTSPVFCLYNSSNVLVSCNSNGTFTIPYGSYCIQMRDDCYDTTITRCFVGTKLVPSISSSVTITSSCSSFNTSIATKTNLTNPSYCLFDAGNNLVMCNTTGVFSSLAFGSYCMKMTNDPACYDTVITRCFTVNRAVPSVGATVTTNTFTCSTFRATLPSISNWSNAQFCLYTASRVLVSCNTTGIFNDVPYGSYCIDAVNDAACYDTTISRCFTVLPPKPSVSGTVTISNKTCSDFTAKITGQANVNNPQYCLYDNANMLVSCNATGTFNNIPYGSYCIKMQNDVACYDTLITRCFSSAVTLPTMSLTALKSCTTIGASDLRVTITATNPAYTLYLYSPSGTLMQTANTSSSTHTFANIANLTSPNKYKIVLMDFCGNKDSATIAPFASVVNRAITISPKCPSSSSPSGYSDVVMNITDNNIGGSITPVIIKKDGVAVSINPSSSSGYVHNFNGLVPATYIFDTDISSCSNHVYDTVVVQPYFFPNLYGSKAYQCDNGSFTVSANIYQGIAPYLYEIFNSSPETPSIQTAPQASPVFNINNGTSYSLIRLRAVDGCGNAGLTDASVLPLSNFIVSANKKECFNESLILRVDSIENATYQWFKRTSNTDSISVSIGASYYIPNLAPADTGRYICKVVVNNGCVVRIANYTITGFCNAILPVNMVLAGTKEASGNNLSWKFSGGQVRSFQLQRSTNNSSTFSTIKTIEYTGANAYNFFDNKPPAGTNFYRVKITDPSDNVMYSNTQNFKNSGFQLSFYPNPVNSTLYVSFSNNVARDYQVDIYNANGQLFSTKIFTGIQNAVINYPREPSMKPGIYIVSVTDVNSKENEILKVIFR